MLRFHISFICHFFIPVCSHKFSRAIYWSFFSRLAGAQFADYITCLATSHFVSVWAHNRLSASSLASHIHTHSLVWMSEYVSFCFMFHVPHLLARLSRAIQHIFSHLAGAQYTDCITCLSSTHFVWVCMSICVSFPMFHVFLSQHAPIGPAEWPWTTTQIGQLHHLDVQRATLAPISLPAHILFHSSALNPRYPVQASPQLKWKNRFRPQQWH